MNNGNGCLAFHSGSPEKFSADPRFSGSLPFPETTVLIWIAISVLLLFNRKTRFIGIISLVALLEVVLINNMLIKSFGCQAQALHKP